MDAKVKKTGEIVDVKPYGIVGDRVVTYERTNHAQQYFSPTELDFEFDAISSEFVWKMYNFVMDYKNGVFGAVGLQEALNKNFKNYK